MDFIVLLRPLYIQINYSMQKFFRNAAQKHESNWTEICILIHLWPCKILFSLSFSFQDISAHESNILGSFCDMNVRFQLCLDFLCVFRTVVHLAHFVAFFFFFKPPVIHLTLKAGNYAWKRFSHICLTMSLIHNTQSSSVLSTEFLTYFTDS